MKSSIRGVTTKAGTSDRLIARAERLGFRFAVAAGAWALLAAAPCLASVRHPQLARKAYAHAVELQRELAARPARLRRPADYERVIREYHNVYYYDFAYVKAPVAAETMGDLYAEMGRRFRNPRYARLAIKYYHYVMSQYPGTSMARDSALSAGKVYLEGLHDPGQAADAYREFLEKHAGGPQAREANKRLKEIAALQNAQKEREPAETEISKSAGSSRSHAEGGPVKVTEIHDWVGPNYTRVVIGAQGPFKYDTLRLSHPDRIVFDLSNTHVSHALLRKRVRIDGAFLRDIRVGQFRPNVTRIVLDVKNINDYSAFPLPNPFRLIIDVHGTSPETARNSAPPVKPAAHATRGRILQASMEENIVPPKPHPAAGLEPEAAPRIRKTAPPETAIEYPDQEAVVAAAESKATQDAHKTEKPKDEAASGHHSEPAATKRTETASGHHTAPAATKRTETASGHHTVPAATKRAETVADHHAVLAAREKSEVASNHPAVRGATKKVAIASDPKPRRTAKHNVEVASNETNRVEIPISTRPASPIQNGSQTLTRALGLKVERIVIDPGHGGFDTGTIGPTGLEEKNVVLDIGLRLRKLFETRTNSEVFMTRSTDKFIPLEERTAIANEDRADLFISIHANASRDHHVRGIETYFLNFTRDPEALQLAARENATSQESVYQLQNLIKKIALNNKIEESQQLARDIQTVLYKRMSRISRGIHNRGVRKAPFVVLIGANMPSVLAEVSFLSNPHSEHLLREPSYREDIAKALFNGIEDYINNLGSIRVAQRTH